MSFHTIAPFLLASCLSGLLDVTRYAFKDLTVNLLKRNSTLTET